MKKKVCIISFSPIARDARVLRQIDYLSRLYKLAVIGYGSTPTQYIGNSEIAWHTIQLGENQPKWSRRLNFLLEIISLLIFRLIFFFNHKAYEDWYWKDPRYAEALKDAIENPSDIYHANDWNALPIAAEAAKICKAKLIFDAHEYAPLEWENHLYWKILYPPMIRYWLRKYAGDVDGFVTVNNEIGDRYQREYELHPTIVMNAPRIKIQPVKKPMGAMINLIHHGAAIPDRKLEKMIDVIGLTREGYHLNFMLTGGAHGYIEKLKKYAQQIAPGRVSFHNPVTPDMVITEIMKFDMGIFLLEPINYNYQVALPNKFFDFISAGLAVVIGPSPVMASFINEYGFGLVAESFEPKDFAALLNRLDPKDIVRMQQASHRASKIINADTEMNKLIKLYEQVLN